MGIPDDNYGQKIGAVICSDSQLTLDDIREWGKKQLPPYQLPTVLSLQNEIPKNAMGKVNKKTLVNIFSKE